MLSAQAGPRAASMALRGMGPVPGAVPFVAHRCECEGQQRVSAACVHTTLLHCSSLGPLARHHATPDICTSGPLPTLSRPSAQVLAAMCTACTDVPPCTRSPCAYEAERLHRVRQHLVTLVAPCHPPPQLCSFHLWEVDDREDGSLCGVDILCGWGGSWGSGLRLLKCRVVKLWVQDSHAPASSYPARPS